MFVPHMLVPTDRSTFPPARRRGFAAALILAVLAAVGIPLVAAPVARAANQVVAPTRVLDTRDGTGGRLGRLGPGEVLPLQIAGIGGSEATSVFVNITTVAADSPGYVTAWPCDQPQPSTSIVNFWPGRAIPNMAVLGYPAAGICFAVSSPVHLIVDVTAFTTAGEVTGIAPERLHDSRDGVRLVAGEERRIQVTGIAGVPSAAATAAVNVTVVRPSAPGYAIVKPCGSATDASTVNFMGGDVTAHFTFAELRDGALCVVSSAATDVVVDVFGWASATSPVRATSPSRVLDTRNGTGTPAGAVASGATVRLPMRGVAGVPADAGAATLNVVIADASADGYVTAWPCDQDAPLASTANVWAGAVVSNQATIKLSASGELCLRPFTADGSAVHLVADAVGHLAAATPATLPPAPVAGGPGDLVSPPPPAGRRAASAGTTVGSAAYTVPTGAIVVAPSGVDTAPGTAARPVRTVARAIALAPVGGTIVLRGGSYGESLTVDKRVTIQPWPNEAAWLDGSKAVTGWVADGTAWRRTGWTTQFDHSPTYTRGAGDTGGFLDPAYPMAAHPDQLWIDGIAMRQVASRSQVAAGTFFHDEAADTLYVGTNPVGRQVLASVIGKAIRVLADGVVLRGFGVRRYAPSVPDLGAITVERSNALLEHIAVVDSATGGISVTRATGVAAANVVLRNVLVARNGFTGLHANYADGLVLDRVLSDGNNAERFSPSPSAAGAKITSSRNLTVRDSIFRNNAATGLWFDHSTYDVKVLASEFRNNARQGVFVEVSAVLRFADNIVAGNAGDGLLVNNTSRARDLEQHVRRQRPQRRARAGRPPPVEHRVRARRPLPERPRDDVGRRPGRAHRQHRGQPGRRVGVPPLRHRLRDRHRHADHVGRQRLQPPERIVAGGARLLGHRPHQRRSVRDAGRVRGRHGQGRGQPRGRRPGHRHRRRHPDRGVADRCRHAPAAGRHRGAARAHRRRTPPRRLERLITRSRRCRRSASVRAPVSAARHRSRQPPLRGRAGSP